MKHAIVVIALLVLGRTGAAQLAQDEFLVASSRTHQILRYSATTGQYIDEFVAAGVGGLLGMSKPLGMAWGPDGHLYVASSGTRQILRYDGSTGAFLGVVIGFPTMGLLMPISLAFGPDGLLYIGGNTTTLTGIAIIKIPPQGGQGFGVYWNGSTGWLGEIEFGPDQQLYVSTHQHGVVRIDPFGGGILDTFVPVDLAWNLWLHEPTGLTSGEFGPGGLFYTHTAAGQQIKRYHASNGAFFDVFVGPQMAPNGSPVHNGGLTYDANGDWFLSIQSGPNENRIGHYDGATGALVRIVDQQNLAGLDGPACILFPPRAGTVYGCDVNPPSSLTALVGLPRVGSTMTLGADDPTGATAPGLPALLVVSRARLGAYPCGVTFPGLGVGGGPGELLVNLSAPDPLELGISTTIWSGPGFPAPFDLHIPLTTSLIGRDFFLQASLIDPSSAPGGRLVLTNALAIRLTL